MNAVELIGTLLSMYIIVVGISLFWRDSMFFFILEALAVGVGSVYMTVAAWKTIVDVGWTPIFTKGTYLNIIPLIIGVCMLLRLYPKYSWLSRFPNAFIIGTGTGIMISKMIGVLITSQFQAMMGPLTPLNLVFWALVIGTVTMTIFVKLPPRFEKLVGPIRKLGRWSVLIVFGVGWGLQGAMVISEFMAPVYFFSEFSKALLKAIIGS